MADLAEPVRLVDNELKKRLAKAKADEAILTASVLERLPDRDELEAEIAKSWQTHRAAVEDAWEREWLNIVPGADLLSALWRKFLGRGYGKAADGLAIAREMQDQPTELAAILQDFMASSLG